MNVVLSSDVQVQDQLLSVTFPGSPHFTFNAADNITESISSGSVVVNQSLPAGDLTGHTLTIQTTVGGVSETFTETIPVPTTNINV